MHNWAFRALANAVEDASLSTSSESADLGLGTGVDVRVVNDADVSVVFAFGEAAVSVTSAWQYRLKSGQTAIVRRPPGEKGRYIAYKSTGAATGTLSVTTGEGIA